MSGNGGHLVLDRVSVDYGSRRAVDEVSIEVRPGEVVAVLGPSGGGKSSLLRAISGLEPLATGAVHLDGVDLSGVPTHRRGVGLMFQEHALFPHRDVAANVAFGLEMAGWSARRRSERIDELLGLVGLAGRGGERVDELSGGERQRVSLARTLAPGPGLVLLDEPLGSLDRALRERLADDIDRIVTAAGTTVMLVTHDQTEAFSLADRVMVMRAGRVERIAAPHELWANPGTVWMARFLGLANVVDTGEAGRVVLRPDRIRLVPDGRPALVRRVRFRGDRSVLVVEVPGWGELEVWVDPDEAPTVGSRVGLDVERAWVLVEE